MCVCVLHETERLKPQYNEADDRNQSKSSSFLLVVGGRSQIIPLRSDLMGCRHLMNFERFAVSVKCEIKLRNKSAENSISECKSIFMHRKEHTVHAQQQQQQHKPTDWDPPGPKMKKCSGLSWEIRGNIYRCACALLFRCKTDVRSLWQRASADAL